MMNLTYESRSTRFAVVVFALVVIGCAPSSHRTATVDGSGEELAAAPDDASADGMQETDVVPDPKAGKTKKAESRKISDEAFRDAAYYGRLETVRQALESGTDVNASDPAQALTALHMAAYNGHSETVRLLIDHGATVDCRDSEGKTPLIHACTGDFAKTVRILIEAGADINARESTEGFTPLMMAAGLGETEVVKVLLRNDVDKSAVDHDGDTALTHARSRGFAEIVDLLQ